MWQHLQRSLRLPLHGPIGCCTNLRQVWRGRTAAAALQSRAGAPRARTTSARRGFTAACRRDPAKLLRSAGTDQLGPTSRRRSGVYLVLLEPAEPPAARTTPTEPPTARTTPTEPPAARPMPNDPGPARDATRLYAPQTAEPPTAPPKGDRSASPALPVDIPQFAVVKTDVAYGQEPFADGVRWLKAHGYRTVLHLRAPVADDKPAQAEFEKNGLRDLSLEVSPRTLSKDIVDQFNRFVTAADNLPLFVYDKDSSLAGGLWYLHFRLVDRQTDDKARAAVAQLGFKEDQDGPAADDVDRCAELLAEREALSAVWQYNSRARSLSEDLSLAYASGSVRPLRRIVMAENPKPASALGPSAPLVPPLYQSSVYTLPDLDALDRIHRRARTGLHLRPRRPSQRPPSRGPVWPSWRAPSGRVVTSSGMAAISAIVLATGAAGATHRRQQSPLRTDHAALPAGAAALRRANDVRGYDTISAQVRAALETPARLLFVETMSNPLLRVVDLASPGSPGPRARAVCSSSTTPSRRRC